MNDILLKCTGFEWDVHNTEKLKSRHGVDPTECEQILFNWPFVVGDDSKHSEKENRFFVLGKTDTARLLFLVFTVRNNRIRVISARDMNRKEREIYQAHGKENSSV
jgi:uncharacterized protein